MDKNAYLDAMGITRWSEKGPELPHYIVLIDRGASLASDHPIITNVMVLFDGDKQVVISDVLPASKTVFWDMRSARLPKVSCTICSAPIAVLEQQSDAKRALWQTICES